MTDLPPPDDGRLNPELFRRRGRDLGAMAAHPGSINRANAEYLSDLPALSYEAERQAAQNLALASSLLPNAAITAPELMADQAIQGMSAPQMLDETRAFEGQLTIEGEKAMLEAFFEQINDWEERRRLWDNIDPVRQEALVAAGFQIPEDPKPGGISIPFTSPFKKIYNWAMPGQALDFGDGNLELPTGDNAPSNVINYVLNAGDDAVRGGVGNVISGLDWLEQTAISQPFRAGQVGYSQNETLENFGDPGVERAMAIGLGGPIGASLLSGLKSGVGLFSAFIQGNAGEVWALAEDRDGTFRQPAIAESLDILDGNVLRHQMAMAYVAHGNNYNAIIPAIEELTGLAPGMPGFSDAYIELEMMLDPENPDEQFLEATDLLFRNKIGLGITPASMLFEPGSLEHNIAAATTELGILIALDPTMAAGKLNQVRKLATVAVQSGQTFNEVRRLRDLAGLARAVDAGEEIEDLAGAVRSANMLVDSSIRRSVGDRLFMNTERQLEYGRSFDRFVDRIVRALDKSDETYDLADAAREHKAINYMREQLMRASRNPEFNHLATRDDVYDWMLSSTGHRALTSGAVGRDPRFVTLPRITERHEQWYRTKQWFRRQTDMSAQIPSDMARDVERNVAEYKDNAITFGEGSQGIRAARELDDRTLWQRGKDSWFGARTLGHRFVHHVPRSRQLSAVSGGTDELDHAANEAILEFERFTEFGDLVRMPAEVKANYVRMFTEGNEAERWITIRSFLSEMMLRTGLGDTSEKVQEIVRRYGFALDQEFGAAAAARADDVTKLTARDIINHNAIWDAQTSLNVAIPDFKRIRRSLHQNWAVRMWGSMFEDVIDAQMTRWWRPTVLFRLGFIPRAAGEETTSFILRLGSLSYLRAQWGRRWAMGASPHPATGVMTPHAELSPTMRAMYAIGWQLKQWSRNTPRHTIDAARTKLETWEKWRITTLEQSHRVTPDGAVRQQIRNEVADIMKPYIDEVRAERGRASRTIEAVANSAMSTALRASPVFYAALRKAKIPSRQDLARNFLGIDFRGLGQNGLPVSDTIRNPFGRERIPGSSEWWSQVDGERLVLSEMFAQHVPAVSRVRNQALGNAYDPYQRIGDLAETTGTLTGRMPLTPVTGRFGRQRYINMQMRHLGMEMIDITDGDFRRAVGQAMIYPAADPVFRESGALVAMSSYVGNATRTTLRSLLPGKFRSNEQIVEYLEGSRRTISRYMDEGEHLDAINLLRQSIITGDEIPEGVLDELKEAVTWLTPILNSTDDIAMRNRVRGLLFPDRDILEYPVSMDYQSMVADVNGRLWAYMSRPDYQESLKTLAAAQANNGVPVAQPLGPDSTRLYTVLVDAQDIERLRTISSSEVAYEQLIGEMVNRLWTERPPAQLPLRQPRYPSNEEILEQLSERGLNVEDWSEARRMLDNIRTDLRAQAEEADLSIQAWLEAIGADQVRYPPPEWADGGYDWVELIEPEELQEFIDAGFLTNERIGITQARQGQTPDTISMWYNERLGLDRQTGEVMDEVINQWRRAIELRYFIDNGRAREGVDMSRMVYSSDFEEMGIDVSRLMNPQYWDEAAVELAAQMRSGDVSIVQNVFNGETAQRHLFVKTIDAMEESGLELGQINDIVESLMEQGSTLQPGGWLNQLLKQRDALPEGETLGRVPALSVQFADPYVATKVSEALDAVMRRLDQRAADGVVQTRPRTSLGYYDHWTDDLFTDQYIKLGTDETNATSVFAPTELDRLAFEPPVEIDPNSFVEFKKTTDGLWFTDEELAARRANGRRDQLTGDVQWATGQTEHATKRSLATQRLQYVMELFTGEREEALTEVLPLLKNNVFDTEYHTLSIPSDDLITEAAKPLTEEVPRNWFERLTGSYFSDVVDPVMQSVIRNPLFNHNFASAMPQAEDMYHMAVAGEVNDNVLELFRRAGFDDDTVDLLIGQIHLTYGVEADGDAIESAVEALATMLANPARHDGADIVYEMLRLQSGEDATRYAAQEMLDELAQVRQEAILRDVDAVQVLKMENDLVTTTGVELHTSDQIKNQILSVQDDIDELAGTDRLLGDYDINDLERLKADLEDRLELIYSAELEQAEQVEEYRAFIDFVQESWEDRLADDLTFEWTVQDVFNEAMRHDDPAERLLYMLHAPINRSRRTMLQELQAWSGNRYHHFQAAMEGAAVRAANMSVEFIDDHRFKSQFQQTIGNLMPFWFAQEQFIKRSLRMLYDSPESIRRASLLMNAGRQVGLIQKDSEGNEIFVYPGTEHINAGLLRFAGLMTGMDGLHVHAQPMSAETRFMLPGYGGASTGSYIDDSLGFGPFIGFSTAFLADTFPELEIIDRTLNRNEVAQGRRPLDHFVPPSVQRLFDITGIDMLSSNRMANAQQRAVQMAIANGDAPPPDASPVEMEQFRDRTRQWARIINIMDAAMYFSGPFPSGNRVSFGDLEIDDAFDRIVFQSGLPWQEGMALFLEKYPDATPWTVFGSENVTGAPLAANAEQYQWIAEHGHLVENMPYAASWLMIPISQQDDDEFLTRARRELFSLGLKRDRTPEEFIEEIYFSQAANDFYPELERFDLTIYELEQNNADRALIEAVKLERETFVDNFERQHPVFARNRGLNGDGHARRQQTGIERQQLLAMPRDELPEGAHVDAMLELMREHQNFIDAMESMKGQSGREVQETRQNLRIQFLAWAQNYAMEHPSTQPYFGSMIRWDDRILDGGTDVVVMVQALTGQEL